MFALRPYRKLPRQLRRLTRIEPKPCEQAKFLRKLVKEAGGPNVMRLRPSLAEESRQRLIAAGVAHCIAQCGGCPITESMKPPVSI